MKENFFEGNSYSIAFAERRDIGDEWNDVRWDRKHLQIQYHRLYYLTSGRAALHLVDRTLELTTGNVYLIPAFSVLQSEIHGEMNKYYIHFQASSPLFGASRYLSGKYCVSAGAMTEALFESVSAIATVGLSLNVSPRLHTASRLLIILFMYFGRVGVLTISVGFLREKTEPRYRYADTTVLIG